LLSAAMIALYVRFVRRQLGGFQIGSQLAAFTGPPGDRR